VGVRTEVADMLCGDIPGGVPRPREQQGTDKPTGIHTSHEFPSNQRSAPERGEEGKCSRHQS